MKQGWNRPYPDELKGEPVQEGDLRGMSSGSFAAGGQSDSLRKTEIEVILVGELRGAEKGSVQVARKTEGAETDPAWKMSELYAARCVGRQPGALTQQEREAKVRASIPGGDKEVPSEIIRQLAFPYPHTPNGNTSKSPPKVGRMHYASTR